jgi:hypothetical protein
MGASVRDRDRRGGGDRDGWTDGKGRKDKDELVDGALVEHLRRGRRRLFCYCSSTLTI